MSKCEHGNKVTHFCLTDNCQHKEAAACELCLKKYHSHLTHTVHLTEAEMQNNIKKFGLDNSVKPKCRTLQQQIYNYFNQIKSELCSSLEIGCKNLINQMGYPYLYSINGISAYKYLKNKEYRKITQKQTRSFFLAANKVQQADLINLERKIYFEEIKYAKDTIAKLQTIVNSYGQCIKRYHGDFTHQSNQGKLQQLIQSIIEQSSRAHRKNTTSILTPNKDVSYFGRTTQKNEHVKTQNEESTQYPNKNNNRELSLDRRGFKQYKPNGNSEKEPQDNESQLANRKIQNLRVELNNKQRQINEKKKQLINIMKTSQTSQLQPSIIPFNKHESPQLTLVKEKVIKKEILSTKPRSFEQQMESSQQIYLLDQDDKEETTNYAFTKLPIEQKVKKEEKQQVKKRMIVVPNLLNLKALNRNRTDELQSPLYKRKRMQDGIQQRKNSQQAAEKPSKKQQAESREVLQLKENQQKSLALLLKSLTLSAQEAILYLQSSLRYADNNLSAAQYLSYLYLQTNRPKQCLALCNKFIDKIQSNRESQEISININNNKAAALNVMGRYSEAILVLQQCLKCKEKDNLYKNLGDSYCSIGMYDKAVYNYEKSIKMNGSNDEAHYNLAVCLYMQQNYQHSKLQIRRAIELNHKQQVYTELQTAIDSIINSS